MKAAETDFPWGQKLINVKADKQMKSEVASEKELKSVDYFEHDESLQSSYFKHYNSL